MNEQYNHKLKVRESNFELLRIVAMVMIVMHHFFFFNEFPLYAQPRGRKGLFILTFLGTEGRVGVDLFLLFPSGSYASQISKYRYMTPQSVHGFWSANYCSSPSRLVQ